MKKQRFFMLGIITVLVAVLSLTFVSSTFAKYTTSGTAEDTARVAKWGVTISLTHDADSKVVQDTLGGDEAHISVSQTEKLLAPGTTGKLVAAQITGTPEVAVKVDVEFTLTLTGWNITGGEYMPLVFTVVYPTETKTYKIGTGSGEYADIDALVAQMTTDIEENANEYPADTNLNEKFDFDLSWSWVFEGENAKDTELGNLSTAPTLSVSYTVKVEQID